jgi:hypothetical protein
MYQHRHIKPVECDRDRTGIERRDQPLLLVLLDASGDRIVERGQKFCPMKFKALVGGELGRHARKVSQLRWTFPHSL